MDEADALVGAEQADRHAGFRQQPHEALVPGRIPWRIGGRGVEVRAVVLHPNEHHPAGIVFVIRRRCPGRYEHRLELGQRDLERVAMRVDVDEISLLPTEPADEQAPQVGSAPADRPPLSSLSSNAVSARCRPETFRSGTTCAPTMTMGDTTRPIG